MFSFLQRDPKPALLAECTTELERSARALWPYVSAPREMEVRQQLIDRALAAGLADHDRVKQLELLQRLLRAASAGDTDPGRSDALLTLAAKYGLAKTSAALWLRNQRDFQQLKEHGPQIAGHDGQGRAIYFTCQAEFKNQPGRFEVAADGIRFTGEVAIEIPWSHIVHVANTVHTYRSLEYQAIAFQEGKRRTATKFVFMGSDEAAYTYELVTQLRSRSAKGSDLAEEQPF